MSHHIYTTEALVVESSPLGEADRFYTLLTRDLGLIRATARGVRLQKSKLRYSLQDFSLSTVSLVRGKDVWRVTSARLEENMCASFGGEKEKEIVVAQLFQLIRRLTGTDEKNEKLFVILKEAFVFLRECDSRPESLKNFEIIAVMKVLDNLGYMGTRKELSQFVTEAYSMALLSAVASYKSAALKEINMSLRESQL